MFRLVLMSVTWSTAFFTTSNSSGKAGSPTSPLVQDLAFAMRRLLEENQPSYGRVR